MHSYHELQKKDAFREDGIEASSHNNIGPNFGLEMCGSRYSKIAARFTPLTISKSDKGLELCAVRTGYILSVQHKLTIHSVYQQSIKTDDSFPLIHKNIISGEQKDRKTATIFLLLRLLCVSAYVQDNIKCTGE